MLPSHKQISSWIKLAISSNGQKLLRTSNWCCTQLESMFNRAICSYQQWFRCFSSLHTGAWYIWTAHSQASIHHRRSPRLQEKSNIQRSIKTHSCAHCNIFQTIFIFVPFQRFYVQKRAHFHLNYLLGAIISVFLFFGFYFHIFWAKKQREESHQFTSTIFFLSSVDIKLSSVKI